MIAIEGPDNRKKIYRDEASGKNLLLPQDLVINASTLREALSSYCENYHCRIEPYDGSWDSVPLAPGEEKYFFYKSSDGNVRLVDIHVCRNDGREICPKQNFEFELLSGDKIYIGELIC